MRLLKKLKGNIVDNNQFKSSDLHTIRPSARLIRTIGEDLIGDVNSALVELVKNSYDADATQVNLKFDFTKVKKLINPDAKPEEPEYQKYEYREALILSVIDDGHGMDYDTVINKWLVPATNDKLKRIKSPKKRFLQGRKGIGRFASAILGEELTLSTTSETEQTTLLIDWGIFEENKLLSEIELLVEVERGEYTTGTEIEIISFDKDIDFRKEAHFNDLINELRKLLSPFDAFDNDKFSITIETINLPFESSFANKKIPIERYPIIDLYDYKIFGKIDSQGKGVLIYQNSVDILAVQESKIDFTAKLNDDESFCGDIEIDLRVFDREPSAFANLISKGLADPMTNEPLGKLDARRALNDVYGVNVYKNKFRISPYGNKGVDWLSLDNMRIQNPSLKIGNNQVVGFVTIQSEEESNLEEKSARDGLKNNSQFKGLIKIVQQALNELEIKRFSYRKQSKKGRKDKNVNETIDDLFNFSTFKEEVKESLESSRVDNETVETIINLIEKEEKTKSKTIDEIKKLIAVYQGQATLGKIVNVVLHEGRKPLQLFNSHSRIMIKTLDSYKKERDESKLQTLENSIQVFKENASLISSLYKRITPFASKRNSLSNFSISETINNSFMIFKSELDDNEISYTIDIDTDAQTYGWKQDLSIITSNLIENSIYWLKTSEKDKKTIDVTLSKNNDAYEIEYKDNGPGLLVDDIETSDIFSPGFTRKNTENASGLGLAIAGESAFRLKGKLIAVENDDGACFKLQIPIIED